MTVDSLQQADICLNFLLRVDGNACLLDRLGYLSTKDDLRLDSVFTQYKIINHSKYALCHYDYN